MAERSLARRRGTFSIHAARVFSKIIFQGSAFANQASASDIAAAFKRSNTAANFLRAITPGSGAYQVNRILSNVRPCAMLTMHGVRMRLMSLSPIMLIAFGERRTTRSCRSSRHSTIRTGFFSAGIALGESIYLGRGIWPDKNFIFSWNQNDPRYACYPQAP